MTDQVDYKLAAGWNNSAGLAVIVGTTPMGDSYPFQYFRSQGTYNPGQDKIRGDFLIYESGYATVQWVFSYLTYLQQEYLSHTYCNDGRAGLVTVRTVTNRANTVANYNAVMYLPKLSESQLYIPGWRDYAVKFSLHGTAS
jgi:hypothetical protein